MASESLGWPFGDQNIPDSKHIFEKDDLKRFPFKTLKERNEKVVLEWWIKISALEYLQVELLLLLLLLLLRCLSLDGAGEVSSKFG